MVDSDSAAAQASKTTLLCEPCLTPGHDIGNACCQNCYSFSWPGGLHVIQKPGTTPPPQCSASGEWYIDEAQCYLLTFLKSVPLVDGTMNCFYWYDGGNGVQVRFIVNSYRGTTRSVRVEIGWGYTSFDYDDPGGPVTQECRIGFVLLNTLPSLTPCDFATTVTVTGSAFGNSHFFDCNFYLTIDTDSPIVGTLMATSCDSLAPCGSPPGTSIGRISYESTDPVDPFCENLLKVKTGARFFEVLHLNCTACLKPIVMEEEE